MPKAKSRSKSKPKARPKRWNWTPKRVAKHSPAQPRAADGDAMVRSLVERQPDQPRH